MAVKSIKKALRLKGKKVLIRVDFNVPVKDGKVLDDFRLMASLPTLEYLKKKKVKVIVVTHIGRPGGNVDKSLSIKPVAKRLGELLDCTVASLSKSTGLSVEKRIKKMKGGDIVILENVRFSPDEKKNTGTLANDLANLADFFVLDGFAVAHRPSASVAGVPKNIKSYSGLLLEKEINGLERVTKRPRKPFVVVIGGAKTETKIPVIKNLLSKADQILIGGGIMNTYLAAAGYKIGDSLVDKNFKKEALLYGKKKKVILPVDLLVGTFDGKNVRMVEIGKKPHQICKKGEGIYDIGPKTIQLFAEHIKKAQTLVWNGAMGVFEQKPYDMGTMSIARLVASRSKGKAYGVIGGGETLQAMDMVGMSEHVDLISTGGGAMLEFLAGEKLPGIEALR